MDAPATIIDFSTTAAEGVEPEADPVAELLTRFRDAIAPEKVFGTDDSDVPGAKPANLARELARASVIAAKAAEAVLKPTEADATGAEKAPRAA